MLLLSPAYKRTFFQTEINMLTANYEYSRNNTENLPLPIEMELSSKLKTFSDFLLHFWNLH